MNEKQYLVDALTLNDSWKMFHIMAEFVEGFETLPEVYPAVTIFGSARSKPQSSNYKTTVTVARMLAENGYNVISGGGPGIMEAANRGAYESDCQSIGMNVVLPFEQRPNPYVTPELSFQFHYFAIRKMHLLMRAKSLVAFPGGFGTMDELFETLTLIQTRKIKPIPVLLFGKDFWEKIINFDALVEEGVVAEKDLSIFQFVETAEDAWEIIAKANGV